MNRLLTILLASATGLALSSTAFAAEQSGDTQRRDNQTQSQPNATKGKPEQSDSQSNQERMKDDRAGKDRTDPDNAARNPDPQGGGLSEEEYSAELKKCDSMQGDMKQQCIDAAKKKAGQM